MMTAIAPVIGWIIWGIAFLWAAISTSGFRNQYANGKPFFSWAPLVILSHHWLVVLVLPFLRISKLHLLWVVPVLFPMGMIIAAMKPIGGCFSMICLPSLLLASMLQRLLICSLRGYQRARLFAAQRARNAGLGESAAHIAGDAAAAQAQGKQEAYWLTEYEGVLPKHIGTDVFRELVDILRKAMLWPWPSGVMQDETYKKSAIEVIKQSTCPTCGAQYRTSDYRPDAPVWFCSRCNNALPRG